MNRQEMNEIINSDMNRYSTTKRLSCVIRLYPGFNFMYYWRKCNYYRNSNFIGKLIYFMYYKKMYIHLLYKYGYEIPLDTKIGKGFNINHISGISINPESIIGCNVNIHKGVTIGQQNRGIHKGSPTIGNRVWIGVNATIVGKITIGNNVLIAPGAFVNFDVPEDSIVIGNPGIIKHSDNAVEDYINRVVEE